MKPLPVIQPSPAPAPTGQHPPETTGMVNDPGTSAELRPRIVEALSTVFDPEIPVNIYELGLIYKIDISDNRAVTIDMTLTTPNCPAAQELPIMVENAVLSVPGVGEAKVNIVWDPPWDPSRMSDEARTVLNMW